MYFFKTSYTTKDQYVHKNTLKTDTLKIHKNVFNDKIITRNVHIKMLLVTKKKKKKNELQITKIDQIK